MQSIRPSDLSCRGNRPGPKGISGIGAFWKKASLPATGGFFSHPGLRKTELNIFLINGCTSFRPSQGNILGSLLEKGASFILVKEKFTVVVVVVRVSITLSCVSTILVLVVVNKISLLRACYSFEPTREGLLERAVYCCCCCNSHRPQTSLSVWLSSSLLRHPRLASLIFLQDVGLKFFPK